MMTDETRDKFRAEVHRAIAGGDKLFTALQKAEKACKISHKQAMRAWVAILVSNKTLDKVLQAAIIEAGGKRHDSF